jgi:hypothetical protein
MTTLEEIAARLDKLEAENRKLKARARAPRRARPAAAAPEPKAKPPEFEGLSANPNLCCVACTPERCVISERDYCSHPRLSGAQSVTLADPVAVARYNRAKSFLKQQEGDDAARRVLGGGYYGR